MPPSSKIVRHASCPLHPVAVGPAAVDGRVQMSQWAGWLLNIMTPPCMRPIGRLPTNFAFEVCPDLPEGRNWATYAIRENGTSLTVGDGVTFINVAGWAYALDALQEQICSAAADNHAPSCLPDPRAYGLVRSLEFSWVSVLAHDFTTGNVYFWPAQYAYDRVRMENGLPDPERVRAHTNAKAA